MEKAYSFRFYPTPEQESLLRRTLGCVRLVYNKALHERTQAWYERQERVGYAQTSSMLTEWKKQEELDFLNEVADEALLAPGLFFCLGRLAKHIQGSQATCASYQHL